MAGYKECGCGMGPALNIGSSTNAYVLTDRGTWLSFKNRGELAILVEGDKRLFNQYGVIVVNPAKHPHVKKDLAQAFADWVVSPAGQAAIAELQDRRRAAVLPERRREVMRCARRRDGALALAMSALAAAQGAEHQGAGRRQPARRADRRGHGLRGRGAGRARSSSASAPRAC